MDDTATDTLAARRVRMMLAAADVPIGRLETVLGLSRKSVTRRVHGRYPFSVSELEKIAADLGVTLADLLGTDLDLRLTVADLIGVRISENPSIALCLDRLEQLRERVAELEMSQRADTLGSPNVAAAG